MASSENRYRKMLTDVACELTDDDAQVLAFRVPFNRSERCKIKTGYSFLDFYEKSGGISKKNVSQLLDLLKERNFVTAAEIVERYQNEIKNVDDGKKQPASADLPKSEAKPKDNYCQLDDNAQSKPVATKDSLQESHINVSNGYTDNSSNRRSHVFQRQLHKDHIGLGNAETHSKEDMVIYVKCDTRNNIMSLNVTPSHTIENLKSIIRKEHEIPVNNQRLVYRQKKLEGSKTLSDSKIKSGSTIHLVIRQPSMMQIHVKTTIGDNHIITVDNIQPEDTIGKVKSKIEDKTGIPCKDKTLYFGYKELDDQKTVSAYNIHRESTLTLL